MSRHTPRPRRCKRNPRLSTGGPPRFGLPGGQEAKRARSGAGPQNFQSIRQAFRPKPAGRSASQLRHCTPAKPMRDRRHLLLVLALVSEMPSLRRIVFLLPAPQQQRHWRLWCSSSPHLSQSFYGALFSIPSTANFLGQAFPLRLPIRHRPVGYRLGL